MCLFVLLYNFYKNTKKNILYTEYGCVNLWYSFTPKLQDTLMKMMMKDEDELMKMKLLHQDNT